jgi:hypothetical protein
MAVILIDLGDDAHRLSVTTRAGVSQAEARKRAQRTWSLGPQDQRELVGFHRTADSQTDKPDYFDDFSRI